LITGLGVGLVTLGFPRLILSLFEFKGLEGSSESDSSTRLKVGRTISSQVGEHFGMNPSKLTEPSSMLASDTGPQKISSIRCFVVLKRGTLLRTEDANGGVCFFFFGAVASVLAALFLVGCLGDFGAWWEASLFFLPFPHLVIIFLFLGIVYPRNRLMASAVTM
jgi:hypothetical protein